MRQSSALLICHYKIVVCDDDEHTAYHTRDAEQIGIFGQVHSMSELEPGARIPCSVQSPLCRMCAISACRNQPLPECLLTPIDLGNHDVKGCQSFSITALVGVLYASIVMFAN